MKQKYIFKVFIYGDMGHLAKFTVMEDFQNLITTPVLKIFNICPQNTFEEVAKGMKSKTAVRFEPAIAILSFN